MALQARSMWLLALLTASASGTARAYTVSNPLAPGCHEKITADALRAVRLELGTAAPIPSDRNDRALIKDLQFTPDDDMADLAGATLLIGVRDNDLKGRSSTDLSELALVHGDPSNQKEHCLRDANQKEPGGSATAVANCHTYILGRVQDALAGLDANGAPDPQNLTSLPLHLDLRGSVDALLPTYYVHIGQALHAIQDSFTHTYRTPDEMQITVVLDWIDEANSVLVEETDGPPHAGELDRCDDPDPLRATRRRLATEASAAVLRATLDPSLSNSEKMSAVRGILDTYLSYKPGCNYGNAWCSAPEHVLGTVSCASSGPSNNAWLGWLFAMGLFAAMMRTQRRRAVKVSALALFLAAGLGTAARADKPPAADGGTPSASAPDAGSSDAPIQPKVTAEGDKIVKTNAPPPPPNEHAPPPPKTRPTEEPGPRDPTKMAFGGFLGISGSIDNGALAGTLAGRLRLTKSLTIGLDAEWNPWLAYNGSLVRAGTFNLYGTLIFRVPLAYEQFNLRVTVNAGASRLLMDLYGAPAGSTGIYLGASPLGLEWKMSRIFYLIINPINFALPAPQLKGVPLVYPQYRATIGLEFYAG